MSLSYDKLKKHVYKYLFQAVCCHTQNLILRWQFYALKDIFFITFSDNNHNRGGIFFLESCIVQTKLFQKYVALMIIEYLQ